MVDRNRDWIARMKIVKHEHGSPVLQPYNELLNLQIIPVVYQNSYDPAGNFDHHAGLLVAVGLFDDSVTEL